MRADHVKIIATDDGFFDLYLTGVPSGLLRDFLYALVLTSEVGGQ